MRSRTFTVVDGTTKTVPMDSRGGPIRVQADYTAGTSFTVEYTVSDFRDSDITTQWTAVTGMSAATMDAVATIDEPVKALRLTHAGTNQTAFSILQAVV